MADLHCEQRKDARNLEHFIAIVQKDHYVLLHQQLYVPILLTAPFTAASYLAKDLVATCVLEVK